MWHPHFPDLSFIFRKIISDDFNYCIYYFKCYSNNNTCLIHVGIQYNKTNSLCSLQLFICKPTDGSLYAYVRVLSSRRHTLY